jgi:hypothetical protein
MYVKQPFECVLACQRNNKLQEVRSAAVDIGTGLMGCLALSAQTNSEYRKRIQSILQQTYTKYVTANEADTTGATNKVQLKLFAGYLEAVPS